MKLALPCALRLLIIGLWVVVGCVKREPERQMVIEPPIALQEQQEFNRAQQMLRAGKIDAAKQSFEVFVAKRPSSGLTDDAIYQIGQIHLKAQNFSEAARVFQRIIERFPTADTALLAKVYYGVAKNGNGEVAQAMSILEGIDPRLLPNDLQLVYYGVLRDGYRLAANPEKLFQTNLQIAGLNPAAATVREELLASIEQMTDLKALDRLADDLDDRFPADYLMMRLARLHAQSGDFSDTKDTLRRFLSRFRDAGKPNEFTQEAEQMLMRYERLGATKPGAIGVLLPLSGNYAAVGRRILNGILLAANLLDVLSPQDDLQIIVRDTAGDPDQAVRAFEELVLDEQVAVVVGPLLKKPAAAVSKMAASYGVPLVLLAQDEGLLGESSFVFQNSLFRSEQVRQLVDFAVDQLKVRRVAILYPNHAYGQEMFQLMWAELAKHPEIQIRGVESYEKDVNDFGPYVRRLTGLFYLKPRASEICPDKMPEKMRAEKNCYGRDQLPPVVDFEALFIPDSAEKVRQIAPTLSYYGIKGVQLLGGNLWNASELLEKGTVDHLQGAIFVDGYDANSSDMASQTFQNRYRQNFGEPPDVLTAQGYDTLLMLREGQRLQALKSREEVKRYLRGLRDFPGAMGKSRFADNGKIERPLHLFMVEGSKIQSLGDTPR